MERYHAPMAPSSNITRIVASRTTSWTKLGSAHLENLGIDVVLYSDFQRSPTVGSWQSPAFFGRISALLATTKRLRSDDKQLNTDKFHGRDICSPYVCLATPMVGFGLRPSGPTPHGSSRETEIALGSSVRGQTRLSTDLATDCR